MEIINKDFIKENIYSGFEDMKLVNIEGISKFYNACSEYLKSLSGKELFKFKNQIEEQIDLKPENIQKVRLLNSILEVITQQIIIKKGDFTINIKQIKPKNKRGKYPCFNNYKIINKIGNGEYGSVWLVKKGKKKYALKVQTIDMKIMSDLSETYKRLENELKKSELMGKYGIGPKVYDYYICADGNMVNVILIMEYMNYGTLESYLRIHSLKESDQIQILDKMKKMHKLGIIHGDIHEGNILVKKMKGKFYFYLGDFGFSKDFNQIKQNRIKSDLRSLDNIIQNEYISTELIAKLMVLVKTI